MTGIQEQPTESQIEALAAEILAKMDFSVSRCELCGEQVDPQRCEDGYTNCCNELILWAGCYGNDDLREAAREMAYERLVRSR